MRKIFCLAFLGIVIISCHTSKTSSGNTVVEKNHTEYLDGNWQLQMLFASGNKWTQAPFININIKDQTFSGNSGCNSIRGKFTIKENYLGFDKNILSTKLACADPKSNADEKDFLSALLKINKYTINKDELELGQGEIVLMKFTRN